MIQSVCLPLVTTWRFPILGALITLFARLLMASPIGVYLEFDERPSGISLEGMRKETAGIVGRVDIKIAWRMVAENQGNEPFEKVVVVKFTGKCSCVGFLQATREILVLGTTAVLDGQALPYSQVRCDAVRRVLPEIEFATDRGRGTRR